MISSRRSRNAEALIHVVGNDFVGRERELAFLLGRLDDAKSGRGAVVAITGDYGIGKTRLVNEYGKIVRQRGGAFASGYCLEYLQAPHAPFVEAFRALLSSEDRITERSRALRSLISEYSSEPGSGGGAPDHRRKLQLFHNAADCLHQIALRGAAAIAIEDIHWADAATLELLEYLS